MEEINKIFEDNAKLRQDCDIQRALSSGEMHNWFVCMRRFKMNSAELASYWDDVKEDADYVERLRAINNKIMLYRKVQQKSHRESIRRGITEGKTYSKVKLAFCGFDTDFIEENGI